MDPPPKYTPPVQQVLPIIGSEKVKAELELKDKKLKYIVGLDYGTTNSGIYDRNYQKIEPVNIKLQF
jgi:Flp pilus assembly secretin CpaC